VEGSSKGLQKGKVFKGREGWEGGGKEITSKESIALGKVELKGSISKFPSAAQEILMWPDKGDISGRLEL